MVRPAKTFASKLVDATVYHERFRQGERHSFTYKVFYALIDVDEIPDLDRNLWTFSATGRSLYSLGAQDFIKHGHHDIKANIEAWLKDRGYQSPVKRLQVFAHLRTLGVNFNPISVFFVETIAETLCLVEVDNTFGDAKMFMLGKLGALGQISKRMPKDFYVSPFIEHDADFIFVIKKTPDTLKVEVTSIIGKEPILLAQMQGTFKPISDWSLLAYFFRMPMIPLKVMAAIHWQALRLMFKKIPYLKKQAFPELQKDYYEHKDFKLHIKQGD